jgi:hypothetical protein
LNGNHCPKLCCSSKLGKNACPLASEQALRNVLPLLEAELASNLDPRELTNQRDAPIGDSDWAAGCEEEECFAERG